MSTILDAPYWIDHIQLIRYLTLFRELLNVKDYLVLNVVKNQMFMVK